MKKPFKIIVATLLLLLVVVLGLLAWVQVRGIPTYAVPPPTYAATPVAITPTQLALGEKLVMADCAGCHLNRQRNRLAGQRLSDSPREFGDLYSANITQDPVHGIGAWTDTEITTLLRTGIGRDGRYRIMMPQFAQMSDEDVGSILAYLRSGNLWVQPDPMPTRAQEPTLLAKVLVNTVMKPLPQPTAAAIAPPATDVLAYGRYLVVGRYVCYECHSKDFKSNNALQPELSEGYLGGGNKFYDPHGRPVISRNLTADAETGIGDWTSEQFIRAVKYGMSPNGVLQEPMPKYSVMSDEEAAAIFTYLRSIPKIRNATPEDNGVVAAR